MKLNHNSGTYKAVRPLDKLTDLSEPQVEQIINEIPVMQIRYLALGQAKGKCSTPATIMFLSSPFLYHEQFVNKYHVSLTFAFPIALSTITFLEEFNKTMYLATEWLSVFNHKLLISPHLGSNSALQF